VTYYATVCIGIWVHCDIRLTVEYHEFKLLLWTVLDWPRSWWGLAIVKLWEFVLTSSGLRLLSTFGAAATSAAGGTTKSRFGCGSRASSSDTFAPFTLRAAAAAALLAWLGVLSILSLSFLNLPVMDFMPIPCCITRSALFFFFVFFCLFCFFIFKNPTHMGNLMSLPILQFRAWLSRPMMKQLGWAACWVLEDFTLVVCPFHRGRGISLLTLVRTSTTSLIDGCLEPVGRKQRAAMVAICFKAVAHNGSLILGSHIAKAFPCLMSGKAQSTRLDKLQSAFSDMAFLPLMISNKSTPKLNTSVSGLMTILKTPAPESAAALLQSWAAAAASVSGSLDSGMEDKLLFLAGAINSAVSWLTARRASPNSPSLAFQLRSMNTFMALMLRWTIGGEEEWRARSALAVWRARWTRSGQLKVVDDSGLVSWSGAAAALLQLLCGWSCECKLPFSINSITKSFTFPASWLYPSKFTSLLLKTFVRMSTSFSNASSSCHNLRPWSEGRFTVTILPSPNLPRYRLPWLDVPIRFSSAKPPVATSRSLYLNKSSFTLFFSAGPRWSDVEELTKASLAAAELALPDTPMYLNFCRWSTAASHATATSQGFGSHSPASRVLQLPHDCCRTQPTVTQEIHQIQLNILKSRAECRRFRSWTEKRLHKRPTL